MHAQTGAFSTKDIEYLRHGQRAMRMRLFKPDGTGPFAAIVDLHGGAWNKGNLTSCNDRDEVFAKAGIAVAAIDFRHASDGYLASMADINYAIRWLKAHATEHGIDANRVGICGQSSGGHLAMLAAMRPNDERYTTINLDVSMPPFHATVCCVGMAWPVINPLSRYRNALRGRASATPPAWIGDIPESHDRYWVTEENMSEGNPLLALERGEKVETPPALWVQGTPDDVHDYHDPGSGGELNEPERFVENYRNSGGSIELIYIDNAERSSKASFDPLTVFFCEHLSV
ncbi:MAG: alpha/beta hydrolase [Pseudomonadota bacterium]|nr:alpha/beta hydrolase [Pseudomonadota bacterium]